MILEDVSDMPGSLPLLEHALSDSGKIVRQSVDPEGATRIVVEWPARLRSGRFRIRSHDPGSASSRPQIFLRLTHR